jgi:hypothetical protein
MDFYVIEINLIIETLWLLIYNDIIQNCIFTIFKLNLVKLNLNFILFIYFNSCFYIIK